MTPSQLIAKHRRTLKAAGIHLDSGLCDLIVASDGRHQIGRLALLRPHQKNAARAVELGCVLAHLLKLRCTDEQMRMINGIQRADKANRQLVLAMREFEKARSKFGYPNWPDVKRHERAARKGK